MSDLVIPDREVLADVVVANGIGFVRQVVPDQQPPVPRGKPGLRLFEGHRVPRHCRYTPIDTFPNRFPCGRFERRRLALMSRPEPGAGAPGTPECIFLVPHLKTLDPTPQSRAPEGSGETATSRGWPSCQTLAAPFLVS